VSHLGRIWHWRPWEEVGGAGGLDGWRREGGLKGGEVLCWWRQMVVSGEGVS